MLSHQHVAARNEASTCSTGEVDEGPDHSAVERAASIEAVLTTLTPAGVSSGARAISHTDVADLRPAERAHIRDAVATRRHEYATGRALLRQLLSSDVEIPTASDRRPVLPGGVSGSLAHDDTFAVAVVAPTPVVGALGVDIEPATPLDPRISTRILRLDDPEIEPHLAFTLKEAVYKAWSGAGGAVLDHHDVRLAVSGTPDGLESCAFRGTILEASRAISGRCARVAGRWIAATAIRGYPPLDG